MTADAARQTESMLRNVIESSKADVAEGRCTSEQAYHEIETRLRDFGLSMHDLFDYPPTDVWEKGYQLITSAISECRERGDIPTGHFWVIDEIGEEKAHGVIVADFAQATEKLLGALQELLREHLPEWFIVISSEHPSADYRIYVRAAEITREPLS